MRKKKFLNIKKNKKKYWILNLKNRTKVFHIPLPSIKKIIFKNLMYFSKNL